MLSSTTRRGKRTASAFAVLALAFATLVALLPTASAHAAGVGDTIGVSGRPADADGQPDGRTGFSYSVDPGQRVDDNFVVTNTGSTRQDFTVFATDAFNAENGAFSLLPTADEPVAVGSWVRFDGDQSRLQFALEPGETRHVRFTLQLPAEATPGDHVAGVVVSALEPGQQVNIDRRVASAIYARVSGELQPRLAVSSIQASHHGEWWNPFVGSMTIRYTVENPGNVALASNVSIGVNTWFGIPAKPAEGGGIPDILPGNSASYEFEVSGIGQLLYLNPYVTLNPFVDDSLDKQLSVDPVSRDTVAWAPPWTILIVIGIIAIIALLIWWKRRRDDAHARAWLEHTQAQARLDAQREAALVSTGKMSASG